MSLFISSKLIPELSEEPSVNLHVAFDSVVSCPEKTVIRKPIVKSKVERFCISLGFFFFLAKRHFSFLGLSSKGIN